jgi:hypothetical protein
MHNSSCEFFRSETCSFLKEPTKVCFIFKTRFVIAMTARIAEVSTNGAVVPPGVSQMSPASALSLLVVVLSQPFYKTLLFCLH